MYIVTVVSNGVTFYLGAKGWGTDRYHWNVLKFPTKAAAYRAYQKAYKRVGDRFKAVPVEQETS